MIIAALLLLVGGAILFSRTKEKVPAEQGQPSPLPTSSPLPSLSPTFSPPAISPSLQIQDLLKDLSGASQDDVSGGKEDILKNLSGSQSVEIPGESFETEIQQALEVLSGKEDE